MKLYSISPEGTKYPSPEESDYQKEFIRIEKLVADTRKKDQEIVVVKAYCQLRQRP